MKKIASAILTIVAMAAISGGCFAKTRYTYVTPKAPYVTPTLKPCIEKYRAGNYTGAMLDLEELVQKEKNNIYAKYYLALCYTKLGYVNEAKTVFNEITIKNTNDTLTYYSKRALACFENPKSAECNPSLTPAQQSEETKVEDDDITKFIYSGKRIHPAAMDLIIKERMEVKLQQDEYKSKQAEQLGPLSSAPTNEEIASALNTLAKIGINPFGQNYMLSGNGSVTNYANNYNALPYGNMDFDINQMLLYSQLGQQKNNFINYGI